MTLLNQYVKENPPPLRGVIMDLVSLEDGYYIRLYRPNINSFSDDRLLSFYEWLDTALKSLNASNPFPIALQIVGHDPA